MSIQIEAQGATEVDLRLRYTGPALETGRMNARELGPAIFSMAETLERAAEVVYRDRARVHVEVDADFRRGSFGIDFVAVATAVDLLPHLTLEELANLIAVLGFAGYGAHLAGKSLLELIRWQNGRPVEKVEPVEEGGYRLSIRGDSVTVNVTEFNLFKDPQLREAVEGIVEPLHRPGVDGVEIQAEEAPPVRVEKDEVEKFSKSLAWSEDLGDDVATAWVEVIAPNFREGNKWRFAQGNDTFYAEILDQEFLGKVRRHEIAFGAGDTLRVSMKTHATRLARKLQLERVILGVLGHWPARDLEEFGPDDWHKIEGEFRQGSMFDEENDESE